MTNTLKTNILKTNSSSNRRDGKRDSGSRGSRAQPRGGPAWRAIGSVARFCIPLLAVIAVWQLIESAHLVNQTLLPGPIAVLKAFDKLAKSGVLWTDFHDSLTRLLVGVGIAAVLGVGVGLAMGLWRSARTALSPIVGVLQPIPGIAWMPIAILWFGLGNGAVLFIVIVGSFFPILFSTINGVTGIDSRLISMSLAFGCSRRQIVHDIVLPGALPAIVTGLRIGFGFGWRSLVAGEMLASTAGLGYMIFQAADYLESAQVIVGMLAIGLFWGLVEYIVLARIEAITVAKWGS